MTFRTLKNFLRGSPSKLDNLERRIRRIEHEISRISFKFGNQSSSSQSKQTNRQKSIDRKRQELSRKSDKVFTEKGWEVPKKREEQNRRNNAPNDVKAKERLLLEFECPQCGAINSRGIKHSSVDRKSGHTDYSLYFTCSNCGWKSDLVNIRATN